MWIFFAIVAVLALLIAVILILPVRLTIKSDKSGEPVFLVKYAFFTFGKGKPKAKEKKKTSAGDELKKNLGIDGLSLKGLKDRIKEKGFKETLSQIMNIIKDVFKEIKKISKHCTAEKFELKVVCTGDDAAAAALKYGECCAVLYPAIGVIGSVVNIKEKGTAVNVFCDYSGKKEKIKYHFVLKVSTFRLLAALWRILLKEYKRRNSDANNGGSKPKNIVS